jgi:autotransporter-associated beta strand protein
LGNEATSASAFTSADTAYFTGVAGTVALGAPLTIGGLVFSDITTDITAGNYVIAGSGANILTLGAPTTSASPTIKVTTGNIAEIRAQVSGANGFTKTGDGSLFLTNSSNNFTGDIYVRAGSLIVSNNSQLGAGNTPITVQGLLSNGTTPFSGGALVLNGATTGFELSRQVNIVGRGPGLVSGSAALISIGYNTLSAGLSLGSLNTESRAWSSFGTTTISGPLTLNSSVGTSGTTGQVMALQGNGNWIISGVVTGTGVWLTVFKIVKFNNGLMGTVSRQSLATSSAIQVKLDFMYRLFL